MTPTNRILAILLIGLLLTGCILAQGFPQATVTLLQETLQHDSLGPCAVVELDLSKLKPQDFPISIRPDLLNGASQEPPRDESRSASSSYSPRPRGIGGLFHAFGEMAKGFGKIMDGVSKLGKGSTASPPTPRQVFFFFPVDSWVNDRTFTLNAMPSGGKLRFAVPYLLLFQPDQVQFQAWIGPQDQYATWSSPQIVPKPSIQALSLHNIRIFHTKHNGRQGFEISAFHAVNSFAMFHLHGSPKLEPQLYADTTPIPFEIIKLDPWLSPKTSPSYIDIFVPFFQLQHRNLDGITLQLLLPKHCTFRASSFNLPDIPLPIHKTSIEIEAISLRRFVSPPRSSESFHLYLGDHKTSPEAQLLFQGSKLRSRLLLPTDQKPITLTYAQGDIVPLVLDGTERYYTGKVPADNLKAWLEGKAEPKPVSKTDAHWILYLRVLDPDGKSHRRKFMIPY